MTKQTANIYVQNDCGFAAVIQLYHRNATYGTQGAAWYVEPGQKGGPLVVPFATGLGHLTEEDDWWVTVSSSLAAAQSQYQSNQKREYPVWTSCQLQKKDAGQDITLSVNTKTFSVNLPSGGRTADMYISNPGAKMKGPIRNVFVVMLENHSFDNIMAASNIEGLSVSTGLNVNYYNGQSYPAVHDGPVAMPTDPGHEFEDVLQQLLGPNNGWKKGDPYPEANNSGFVFNYATSDSEETGLPNRDQIRDIMLAIDMPKALPVTLALANEFAICNQWYSSIPGPTWPNRFFLHGASSNGWATSPSKSQMFKWETVSGFTYPNGSVFDALSEMGVGYNLYIDQPCAFTDHPADKSRAGGVAQVAALAGIHHFDINDLSNLANDVQQPYPYGYTFIEPNYGNITKGTYRGGSSQHPMDDVYGGEGLLKYVYETVRNSPLWLTSMIIVTYDEHGGFYDHMPPPQAVPPEDGSATSKNNIYKFQFDRLGVRVPGFVISPYTSKQFIDNEPRDHACVSRTLSQLFGTRTLTDRDANAVPLTQLLNVDQPRTDCRSSLPNPVSIKPPPAVVAAREAIPAPEKTAVPESGNIVGTLYVMGKARAEMSDGSVKAKRQIEQELMAINTMADAESFIEETFQMMDAQRAMTEKPEDT